MAKSHMFDVALAEKYGPIESIILSNLCFWIEKNQHNQKNFYKGRYWVYNSTSAFEKIFTYLNKDQIRRVLDKLFKQGALYIDNFNKIGYDRTLWYSVSDEVMEIYTAGKSTYNKPPPAQTGNAAQMGKWSENDAKTEILTDIDTPSANSPEMSCPNGQMHFANSPYPFAQTGNTDQMGKWDKNNGETEKLTNNDNIPANTPETPCPNGQMHFANLPNPFDENATSISQIRQIDSAESPHPFGDSATPIPDINIYKPSEKPSDSEAEKKYYLGLFLDIDRRLVFSEDFYEKAKIVRKLNFTQEGETFKDYCQWLYQKCLDLKPDDIRSYYYTVFNKPEMLNLFFSSNINDNLHDTDTKIKLTKCPLCGTSFHDNLSNCPSCKMRTIDMDNPSDIEQHKRYLALSEEERINYDDELQLMSKKFGTMSASQFKRELHDISVRYGLATAICDKNKIKEEE